MFFADLLLSGSEMARDFAGAGDMHIPFCLLHSASSHNVYQLQCKQPAERQHISIRCAHLHYLQLL